MASSEEPAAQPAAIAIDRVLAAEREADREVERAQELGRARIAAASEAATRARARASQRIAQMQARFARALEQSVTQIEAEAATRQLADGALDTGRIEAAVEAWVETLFGHDAAGPQ
jgi:vacuolar-type H+-ATPase subunit H